MMNQYVCSVCSYVYDEAVGIPEANIPPGTRWEDLPADFKCPVCGAGKGAFSQKQAPSPEGEDQADLSQMDKLHVDREMSAMEMSIICSNLARGCEKQYLEEQSEGFKMLAEFFRKKAEPVSEANTRAILELLEADLSVGYPYGMAAASEKPDRGAQRCQVWSEKVTRMLQSLLTRYQEEGEGMLENTGVYVCSVCGFVYVGDEPPALCPVCKVPAWKFEKAERREV